VRSGGVLDFESTPTIDASDNGSFIDNYGVVQKTTSGATAVQMGVKNEASTAQLVNSGGTTQQVNSTLQLLGKVPSSDFTVVQAGGSTVLYDNSGIDVRYGYQQNAGSLSVMGRPNTEGQFRGTRTTLNAETDGTAAEINGGAVILSDGTDTSHSAELSSNMTFKFGATSELRFGKLPNTSLDLLYTYSVEIASGAKAVLTEGTTNDSQRFVRTDNGIVGAFTPDVGTYAIEKQNGNKDYYLILN
jgi:hypothetical protein